MAKRLFRGTDTFDRPTAIAKYTAYKNGALSKEDYTLFLLDAAERYVMAMMSRYCCNQQDIDDMVSEARLVILENIDVYDPRISCITTYFDTRLKDVAARYFKTPKGHLEQRARVNKALEDIGKNVYNYTKDDIKTIIQNGGLSRRTIIQVLNEIAADEGRHVSYEKMIEDTSFDIPSFDIIDDGMTDYVWECLNELDGELFNLWIRLGESDEEIQKALNLTKEELIYEKSRLIKKVKHMDFVRDTFGLTEMEI